MKQPGIGVLLALAATSGIMLALLLVLYGVFFQ